MEHELLANGKDESKKLGMPQLKISELIETPEEFSIKEVLDSLK
ncbi:hypothetical protein [Caldifermentibacillus hisashii]